MKKLVIVLAVVAMAFAMSSCSNGGSTPTKAGEKSLSLKEKRNELDLEFKKASYEYVSGSADEQKEMEEDLIMKDFKVTKEEIDDDGETATVSYEYVDSKGDKHDHNTLSVKKFDGNWYTNE